MRMTKEAISLHSLNQTLNRVENRLQNVERQFKELNSAMEKLTQKLQFQDKALEKLVGEDEMWIYLLEDRFTSVEINLFYSYVSEMLCCLHSCVRAELPDLAGGLPTLASVMRRKGKNQRIRLVWEAVLEMLGMQEGDVLALCTFFIIHCSEAQYYPANQRQKYTSDISMMITKVVKNQILRQSLLCAVQVVETRRAQMDPKKIATLVQK